MKNRLRGGFTLIELLLVIGIIAILAAIVIVAINPTKQLADARNTQRRSDVGTILNSLYQYAIDNQGNFPSLLTGAVNVKYEICVKPSVLGCGGKGYDTRLLMPTYLIAIPQDPRIPGVSAANLAAYTGSYYFIEKASLNPLRIAVTAPAAENSATISVQR